MPGCYSAALATEWAFAPNLARKHYVVLAVFGSAACGLAAYLHRNDAISCLPIANA